MRPKYKMSIDLTPALQHTCTLVTDCDGNKQVVVVGGADSGTSGLMYGMNSTEIYDVNSGTWSAGERNRIFLIKLWACGLGIRPL